MGNDYKSGIEIKGIEGDKIKLREYTGGWDCMRGSHYVDKIITINPNIINNIKEIE